MGEGEGFGAELSGFDHDYNDVYGNPISTSVELSTMDPLHAIFLGTKVAVVSLLRDLRYNKDLHSGLLFTVTAGGRVTLEVIDMTSKVSLNAIGITLGAQKLSQVTSFSINAAVNTYNVSTSVFGKFQERATNLSDDLGFLADEAFRDER